MLYDHRHTRSTRVHRGRSSCMPQQAAALPVGALSLWWWPPSCMPQQAAALLVDTLLYMIWIIYDLNGGSPTLQKSAESAWEHACRGCWKHVDKWLITLLRMWISRRGVSDRFPHPGRLFTAFYIVLFAFYTEFRWLFAKNLLTLQL